METVTKGCALVTHQFNLALLLMLYAMQHIQELLCIESKKTEAVLPLEGIPLKVTRGLKGAFVFNVP